MAGNDEPAKTSQALTPGGQRLVHLKAPEKRNTNLKASRKPPTGVIRKPEATTGE
jgi:hypothetical protein